MVNLMDKILKKLKVPKSIRIKILKYSIKNYTYSNSKNYLEELTKISEFPKGTSISTKTILDGDYDLSIIVPAYNVQDYIRKCITSLVNQKTKYKYKVIIVNDGSTDNTMKYLKLYKKYNFVTIIDQKNKGFSGARNKGLDYVSSKYISFVDSDDYVSNNYVEQLMNAAYKHNADIVEGSYQVFSEQGVLEKNIERIDITNDPFQTLYGYPWGKAYKKDLLNNVQFPENFWYEDTMAMYRIWPLANKVVTISPIIYNYRKNINGITISSKGKVKSLDSLYITIRLLMDCDKLNMDLTQSLYEFTLNQMIMNFNRIVPLGQSVMVKSFFVMANTIDLYFPESKYLTKNFNLKPVEKSLRSKNYRLFAAYCLF